MGRKAIIPPLSSCWLSLRLTQISQIPSKQQKRFTGGKKTEKQRLSLSLFSSPYPHPVTLSLLSFLLFSPSIDGVSEIHTAGSFGLFGYSFAGEAKAGKREKDYSFPPFLCFTPHLGNSRRRGRVPPSWLSPYLFRVILAAPLSSPLFLPGNNPLPVGKKRVREISREREKTTTKRRVPKLIGLRRLARRRKTGVFPDQNPID